MSTQIRNLILAFSALVFVAACGGSDGSDGGNDPIIVTGDLVTLSSDNATTIAGVVAEELLEDNLLGSLTTSLPVVSAGPDAMVALQSLTGLPLPPGVAAAQIPQDCTVSGFVDVDFNISDPTTISPRDEFTFDFRACVEGDGTELNGVMIMTVIAIEGDPSSEQFLLEISVELSAFSVTEGNDVASATGTISVSIDTRFPPVTTIMVSTSALTTTQNGVAETVSNVTITVSEDESVFPTAVTVEQSFRISSPRLGGDVIVSTSIALQSSGEEFPFAGEVRIEAAGNSAIVMIVLDSNTVRLEIDINGDDAPDEVVDVTWDDLMAAAEAA